MKGEIYLLIDEYKSEDLFTIKESFLTNDTYRILVNATPKTNAKLFLKKSAKFNKYLEGLHQKISFETNWKKSTYLLSHLIKDHLVYSEDIIENCQTIHISGELSVISNYLDNNQILKSSGKKIILDEIFDLSIETYNKLKELFGNYPNVYYMIKGNEKEITLDEYQQTILIIDEVVEKINLYNFSPLEKIFYVYDIVRDRLYKKELPNESTTKSRDLTQTLLGENIVCVGFVNIFNAILTNLGINCTDFLIINEQDRHFGHLRSAVYIEDEKYHIKGIYLFDPTWDSKKQAEDNSFLNSYRFFAKTKEEMEVYDKPKYQYETFKSFSSSNIEVFETLSEHPECLSKALVSGLNEVAYFIDDHWVINPFITSDNEILQSIALNSFDREKIIKKLWEYNDLFDNPISANILLTALYNVRKIKYYEDEEKYPLELASFETILSNSFWTFDEEKERLLLNALLGLTKCDSKTLEIFKKYLEETELRKQINQVKLAKVLRKVYLQKTKQ